MRRSEPSEFRGAAVVFAAVPLAGFLFLGWFTLLLWTFPSDDDGDEREWVSRLGLLTAAWALGVVATVALVYFVWMGRVPQAAVAFVFHGIAAVIILLVGLDMSVRSDGLVLGIVGVVEFCAVMAMVNGIRDARAVRRAPPSA